MKTITTVLLVLLTLALSACQTDPKVEYQYRNVLITIPSNLITDCPVTPPPKIKEYLEASADRKEEIWVEVYKEATQYVTECNIRMKAVREWNDSQKKIHSDDKKE
jgi:hypothetical protein